jgi:hypothetical protein
LRRRSEARRKLARITTNAIAMTAAIPITTAMIDPRISAANSSALIAIAAVSVAGGSTGSDSA